MTQHHSNTAITKTPCSLRTALTLLLCMVVASFSVHAQSADTSSLGPIWKPKDVAIAIIDYQPEMLQGLKTTDPNIVGLNVRLLARLAKLYDIPVVLSTVGVGMGYNKPTVDSIRAELPDVEEIDRSTMNAWDDENFVKAIKETGRSRLIMVGLWTEICLIFPVVEAMAQGYEVSFVVDAIGGTSQIAHEMAIERMIQAGAIPTTTPTLSTELFRDWLSEDGKKVGPTLDWYLTEISKDKIVDVFASPSP